MGEPTPPPAHTLARWLVCNLTPPTHPGVGNWVITLAIFLFCGHEKHEDNKFRQCVWHVVL